MSAAFAKITMVLMRTPKYRQMLLSDLERLLVPALATGQFLIAEVWDKASGSTVPVSAVLWATVSDAVDQRLTSSAVEPVRLKAGEWKSGNIPWLVAVAGETRAAARLLKVVAERHFDGSGLRTIARDADGKPAVRQLFQKTVAAASSGSY